MSEAMAGTPASAPSSAPSASPSQPSSSNIAPQSQGNAGQTTSQPQENGTQSQKSPQSDTFDVKVNGRMVKMTRDEATAYASMGLAAQSRFDEASKMRKEIEQFRERVNQDPIKMLMDAGLSREQARDHFEKWYTQEFIEPETLTAEQRRLKEYERKVQMYEQQQKELEDRAHKDQEEKLTNQQREYLQKQIIDAMDSSGLPKTKWFVQRMAFYMKQNIQNGWDAPMDMIVTQVKNDRQNIMSDITEQADVPTLINLFGEGIIKKINQYYLNQLRQNRQAPMKQENSSGVGVQGSASGVGKVSYEEVQRRLRDLRTGRFK